MLVRRYHGIVCWREILGALRSAFTLIEMLVVIVVIAILAALLMPAFQMARERSRQANCKSQLHQFAVAVDVYRIQFPDFYPPWLSTLYPDYISAATVYICRSDPSQGREGGMPEWFAEHNASQFKETDDTRIRDQELVSETGEFASLEREAKKARHTEVAACSYIYEFSTSPCSWWYGDDGTGKYGGLYDSTKNNPDKIWADFDNDGYVSWREAKRTEQKGMEYDASSPTKYKVNPQRIYGGHVPMVRCFWHANRGRDLNKEIVLNLACENKNVYECTVIGAGWQQAASK